MAERTPLYDAAQEAGASWVEEAGWLLPAHFGNAAEEYRQAREQAVVFDRSHHGKVEVAGKDAAQFLHNLCTNDVNHLAIGAGREAFLTTGQARIVAHVLLGHRRWPDGREVFWVDVGPGMGEKIFQHLDRHLISEQVELADRTRECAQLHLAGPAARAILERVLGGPMPDLAPLHHLEQSVGGAACLIRRHEPLGLPGFDLIGPSHQAEEWWRALREAGASPGGLEAYHVLRVEAGTPAYGLDIDETNLPLEVGRTEQAVSFTKGCYIGQETVARIRTYGHVNRSLAGLKLSGTAVPLRGARLYRDGKEVGQVTSAVYSPRLGAPLALAYIRRGSEQAGTQLEIETAAGQQAAEVVTLPVSG